MKLGFRIHSLWQMRRGLIGAVVLSALVALWSVQQISLFPPSVTPRKFEMASATTHVVVDTPRSAILDLREDTYSLQALTNRTVLLGSIIASAQVRQTIARLAGVPVQSLQIQAPLTPSQPRTTADASHQKKVGDILKSMDQYRLDLEANPTVPILDIYAQTPDPKSAAKLADSAVTALRQHLAALAAADRTPLGDQIRLRQLGPAHGAVINNGVDWQVVFVVFFLTLGLACASLIVYARVREGWRLAVHSETVPAD
ncbi:MAG TPA: hypothetical protein VH817_20605 [Thermoleophilaceae bacterium]